MFFLNVSNGASVFRHVARSIGPTPPGMFTPLHLAMCIFRAGILLSPAVFAVLVLLWLYYR